ncbi:hypothetical protein ACFRKE_28020 [Kitasatospora indigofera]|uniref:Integral membrane protein n=1 Tax=Kitasatospora indigofera TaxID=67307 RepID=A0A918YVV3_9ACTN|nr:hypothetical protein [Kitasatospora indigofera]GHE26463.1 hypothetical protein GCM10018781_78670 [Kitasatospora indigofera]
MHRLLPWPRRPEPDGPAPARTDYSGAVYGSLLAASVIAATSSVGDFPRLETVVLLLVTGLVFWAAHVYARLTGERSAGRKITWAETRRVGGHEWSIVEAAVLPSIAVAVSPLLGLGLVATGWFALGVAVAQQVTWAYLGALHASASRREAGIEAGVNLVLGLIIVAAKAGIGH